MKYSLYKNSLSGKYKFYLIVLSIVTVVVTGILLISFEIRQFKEDSVRIKHKYVDEKKINLKSIVESAIGGIKYVRLDLRRNMNKQIEQEVKDAIRIATNLHEKYINTKSEAELKIIIKEALRTLRFFNGRGYLFILDNIGNNHLYPINEKIEGTNLLNIKDVKGGYPIKKIINKVKTENHGFVTYYWQKPFEGRDRTHLKTAYVAKLPFYDWIIGTGEYLEELEFDLQDEFIRRLENYKYEKGSYLYVVEFDGSAVVVKTRGIKRGDYIGNLQDEDGVNIFDISLENALKKDGGYYYYKWKLDNAIITNNLCYVKAVSEWQWIIGSFSGLKLIEELIAENKNELYSAIKLRIIYITILLSIVILLMLYFGLRLKRSTDLLFERYIKELEVAIIQKKRINIDNFSTDEFKQLSILTNKLLKSHQKVVKELEKSESELKKLNKTKDRFFSIIAHDLKNPFSSLLGILDLLIEEYDELDEATRKKYLNVLNGTSKNLFELLLNLLQWARTQTHSIHYAPERFNLSELIHKEIEILNTQASEKSISLDIRASDNTFVIADKNMLSNVIRNLVNNAIKFTNQAGIIIIEVEEQKEEVIVRIKDNGVGMSNKQIENLFSIEEKVSTAGTYNEAGTGLGFIICKEFIEKNNGKLKVESLEGEGSVFYFNLPV